MAGRIVINHFGRDCLFEAPDLIVAAIERVVREQFRAGKGLFIAGPGDPSIERERAVTFINPSTFVAFTYTDLGDGDLQSTTEFLRECIRDHGGIELDANDHPVTPR